MNIHGIEVIEGSEFEMYYALKRGIEICRNESFRSVIWAGKIYVSSMDEFKMALDAASETENDRQTG